MKKRNTRVRSGLALSAALLSMLLLIGLASCNGEEGSETESFSETESQIGESETSTDIGDETKPAGPWGENIDYALNLQNGVQEQFTNSSRTKWTISNRNVVLNCEFNNSKPYQYTSITNKNGIPYMDKTGEVYLIDADGNKWGTSRSVYDASCNIYELGYYFYNAHVQDYNFGAGLNRNFSSLRLDTTLYMYSDKLNVVQHIVSNMEKTESATGLAGYGQYYEINANNVLQFVAKDAAGLHYNYDEVDWSSAEYVGFDIKDAGVIGFVLLQHENSGKLTVTLADGVYTIDQQNQHDVEASFGKSLHIYFGMRLYTDDTHDFAGFLSEAKAERNLLKSGENILGSSFLEYDSLRGAYKGSMPTVGWGSPSLPNSYSFATLKWVGDDMDRKFYYYTDCGFGALECSVMLDENNSILPIALEVTKNFGDEDSVEKTQLYYPGDKHYGNTYVPVTLKAGESKQFTLAGLNMNWGKTPLKQLSSIQFYAPYYHLSLGPWESNCISMNGNYGKDYWTLPDFRPVGSGIMSQGQYIATSVIRIMTYNKFNGAPGGLENCHDHIDSSGPIYADITMDYLSDDGCLDVSYRHVELPNEDENRTLYSVRIDVLKDLEIKNFREDFRLFSFNGRNLQYGTMTYLNKDNEITRETIMTEQATAGFKHDRYVTLGNGEAPYFGYYNAVNFDYHFHPNFALILKDWDIKIGGKTFNGNFVVRDYFESNMTYASLSLDIDESVTLKAGDYIYFDMILMPWGRQYDGTNDPAENDDSIQKVRQDTVVDPFVITAQKGTVIEDIYVPKIHVDENGEAQFTITGGVSNGVVRVYGLTSYSKPVIMEAVDSVFQVYDNSSSLGYDGYMVYAEKDGTYSIAFAFNVDDVGEEGRTFYVKAGA